MTVTVYSCDGDHNAVSHRSNYLPVGGQMEPAVPSGVAPFSGDTGILSVVEVEDDFEAIYDVPFVTVNRVGGELQAEVIFSGVKDIDQDRVETALSVASERGYRAYARVFGDMSNVLIYFSSEPSKGIVWGLEDEVFNWS